MCKPNLVLRLKTLAKLPKTDAQFRCLFLGRLHCCRGHCRSLTAGRRTWHPCIAPTPARTQTKIVAYTHKHTYSNTKTETNWNINPNASRNINTRSHTNTQTHTGLRRQQQCIHTSTGHFHMKRKLPNSHLCFSDFPHPSQKEATCCFGRVRACIRTRPPTHPPTHPMIRSLQTDTCAHGSLHAHPAQI